MMWWWMTRRMKILCYYVTEIDDGTLFFYAFLTSEVWKGSTKFVSINPNIEPAMFASPA